MDLVTADLCAAMKRKLYKQSLIGQIGTNPTWGFFTV